LIYNYEGAMVPHFMGYDWTVPPTPPNPLKHTIYSLWGVCQAQIIKIGNAWSFSDAGGSYFLWKAYTEWSNVGPYVVDFTKTGLGYMLMQGFIQNEGRNLCESKPIIIKVDCCLKPEEERQVILYWESLSGHEAGGPTCVDQAFMFYGSIKICEVPPVVGPLWAKLCTPRNTKYLYVIPQIKKGCLPFTWELSAGGGWTLDSSKPLGEGAGLRYECTLGAPGCHESVDVTVTDRCGTTDTFHSQSCCEQAAEGGGMSIGYTSLLMSCSGSQTLTAGGGCGPYSWGLSGGGTLVPSANTFSALYTSPATNPNCTDNSTITVTDCCGSSAQLQLAVNCYTLAVALVYCEIIVCELSPVGPGGDPPCHWHGWLQQTSYDCSGTFIGVACYGVQGGWYANGYCPCPGTVTELGCPPSLFCATCRNDACGLIDYRSLPMKEAGCCPLNPLTGLPY